MAAPAPRYLPKPLTAVTPYAARLAELAVSARDEVAIVEVAADGNATSLTWGEFDRRSNQVARLLESRGVEQDQRVALALPSGLHHALVCAAAWKLGSAVLPVNPASPGPERQAVLELFGPTVVVAREGSYDLHLDEIEATTGLSDESLPVRTAEPGKVMGTGGSTGRPKLIVQPGPWGLADNLADYYDFVGLWQGQTQLVCSPMYHNFGFDRVFSGLLWGMTSVVMHRFNAALAVDIIERYSVDALCLVPTMMAHIAALPDIAERDLSSIRKVFHTAGPCAPSLKRRWIELVGPEAVLEIFGSTEGFGYTFIDGNEWLEHPGSVGFPFDTALRITDDEGQEVPPGTIGEIWMRREGVGDNYIGAVARIDADGFGSVGDLGWVDEDGYLYLADRRNDLILRGGANVYPAEVEGVLHEHPAVVDVAVVGVPHETLGQAVHAVVQLDPEAPPTDHEELTAFCRERLVHYKAPASYDFVTQMPRDESGKLRRRALLDRLEAAAQLQQTR